MSSERLLANGVLPSEAPVMTRSSSSRQYGEPAWIFEELPKATIESVSRSDTGDISPMLLSYTIDIQYKQFKWRLVKKASQVLYLHFALKKRAFIEELYEKQEQAKEWLQSLGIVDQTAVVQDDDEPDDGAIPLHHEESVKNRNVPSSAALPIIRSALGGQQSISERAKGAMQGYLNHFLGNMDIVNSREVCKFLEVSKLSFSREYGSKLKEGYIMVKHLPGADSDVNFCVLNWTGCCQGNWEKVWVVLKPGFLAFLDDPFDTKLLDIIVFDVQPASGKNGVSQVHLASPMKEHNLLRYAFKINCGSRSIKLRTSSMAKVKEWVTEINKAGMRPQEGWCHTHRFGSYAPQRGLAEDGSQAQWFIDGQAAFKAIASSIENAKSEILITGWWICPEMFLKRPFDRHSSSRLEALLEEKAKQGVQIYILLYKEVSLALKINSMYSKTRLLNIHENVRVLRYPDHISTGVYYWSHHEKLVIVDYQICFIGGLDLCFGRYDTIEHKVGDYPPLTWPGKDYYNPRESEPNSWEDTMTDEVNRKKLPRMPWHDVHCALWGPPCRDVARHFVQRWNHAKRNKAPNEQTIPLLMPHHHMVLPHYMGRSRERDIDKKSDENQKGISRQDSFSSQSPLQDIPLLLPQEADGLAASNVDSKLNGLHMNHNLVDQPNGERGSYSFSFQKSEAEDSAPDARIKSFAYDLDCMDLQSEMNSDVVAHCGMKASDECETPKEGDHDVAANDCVGPCTSCHVQIIRSVSQWSAGTSQPEKSIHSAYCSLIEKAQHFIYVENQFFISGLKGDEIIQNRVLEALYRRIVKAHKEQKCFRVIVVLPLLPGFQGGLDDSGAATVRALVHWQYRTISREKHSILDRLNVLLGPKTHDYITFYGLRSYGRLFNGGPVATSQVYVHSKLMIIDDRIAVIGSSNINDRSLLGSRDSEIGVVIEDKEFLDSSMNGEPWQAGKFAYSLRCSLWSEHLGLSAGEISQISDPLLDSTYRDLWLATAKENSIIYQDVFSCIPNDHIRSRAALRQSMAHWKEKLSHTTIDLGIAPEKLESYNNGELKLIDPMERLQSIRGHLVSFPLEFMCEENNMKPVFNESEFYAAPQVFH
ncbi:phospholipase D zeta 1-like isoform X1 [Juglans microcarpa x Juglans regia]|uniref:phospholipase D zeta 1-like isoform X1 n=1 Tax=Juglans microcarpa x Juglans regia TaxID=2249226 RepID=UPI001B7F6A46|nr:phospholipase D zeta 1-like isoform X1 [Juglans microcarpa x Juglans regia]